jgi:hypothetical protein
MSPLQHVNVKVFAEPGGEAPAERLISIFHRWIQDSALPGLLIDVTDYSHVPAGPGVMLIGHDAFYSVDHRADRTGFLYNRRTAIEGSAEDALRDAWKGCTFAARLLEHDLNGAMRFNERDVELWINDRLLAPNTPETFAKLAPEVQSFFDEVYGSRAVLTHQDDPRGLFRLGIQPAS